MISRFTVLIVAAAVFACDEPPAQDPSQQQVSYQNGYPQTTAGASPQAGAPGATQAPQGPVTYTPTDPAAAPTSTIAAPAATQGPTPATTTTAPTQIQTTPVPVGVQALPPPSATGAKPPAPATTTKTMAVPGPGAFSCQSDSQCLLGRCNTLYGRCAYPCKNSDIDCKPNNVCTAAGLCMPRAGGGLGM